MDDAELTIRLCRLLGEIDGWKWKPETTATYAASDVRIDYGRSSESANRSVSVRVYGGDDDHVTGLTLRWVQLRFRGKKGDIASADRMAGEAFAHFQGLSRREGISGIRRLSMAPLGADTNGRDQRTDNYLVTLDNPEAS